MENRVLLAIEFVKDVLSQHYPALLGNYARAFRLPRRTNLDIERISLAIEGDRRKS
jgi:hypothetical protein